MPEEKTGSVVLRNLQGSFSPEQDQKGYKVVGYKAENVEVKPEYLITITSEGMKVIVVGLLQDNINMKVSSRWEPFVPGRITSLLTGDLVQFIFGRTGVMPFMTRRSWQGTTPISISLVLRFEAVNDALSEVLEPCLALQAMALPYEVPVLQWGNWEAASAWGEVAEEKRKQMITLAAPGPNPYGIRAGDDITVEIGRVVGFEKVIFTDASLDIATKFTKDGHPISATVNVQFETYEVMTKSRLWTAYHRPLVEEVDYVPPVNRLLGTLNRASQWGLFLTNPGLCPIPK